MGGSGPTLQRRRRRSPVRNPLVEAVSCKRVTNPLCSRGRIVESISAAHDRLVSQPERKTEPWRDVVFVHVDQATSNARLTRRNYAERAEPRIEPIECLLRRNHEAPFLAV